MDPAKDPLRGPEADPAPGPLPKLHGQAGAPSVDTRAATRQRRIATAVVGAEVFRKADPRGVDLVGVHLVAADLVVADLVVVDLVVVDLVGAVAGVKALVHIKGHVNVVCNFRTAVRSEIWT